MEDRRQHPRVAVAYRVRVQPADGTRELTGLSADLSYTGMFIHLKEVIPEAKTVALTIEDGSDQTPLQVTGVVVHSVRNFGIGVQFGSLPEAVAARLGQLVATLSEAGGQASAEE